MVIEFEEKNKIRVGSIYPTIKTIKTKSAKMTIGTPVRVLNKSDNIFTVEDYRGNQWEVKNDGLDNELSSRSIDEMPKTYTIFNLKINIYQIINTLYNIFFFLLVIISILIIVLADVSVMNIMKMMLAITILVLFPPLMIRLTDNMGLICLFENKKNIDELQILLINKLQKEDKNV